MRKRELYRLEKSENGVCVYFTQRNVGRIGVVFKGGYTRYDSRTGFGRNLPQYIISEARRMLQPPCAVYDPCQIPKTPNTVCFTCGWIESEHVYDCGFSGQLIVEATK